MKLWALFIAVIFGHIPSLFVQIAMAAPSSGLVINEVQTGGLDELIHEDGKKEFIELYNSSTEALEVTGYRLQYFSATREDIFDISATPTRELGILDGQISSKGYVLLSYEGYIVDADLYFGQGSTSTSGLLAKSGGHVRLLSSTAVIDVVGWGAAKKAESKALPEITPGQSYERKIAEGMAQDTDNNFEDYIRQDLPTPMGGSLVEAAPEQEPEPEIPACNGLMISEIMPNPDGDDSGKEFIELYNPGNEDVTLVACTLSSSSSSAVHSFAPGSILKAKEYKAFYDVETGIGLTNAAGGTVTLFGTDAEYIVTYPPGLEANEAWIVINGEWQTTNQPTPNLANVPSIVEPKIESDTVDMADCGPGRYRHPETNRCRNVLSATAVLTNCQEGHVRNPETNRCRSIAALTTSLIPCRDGQVRSPETNRCRTLADVSQAECQAGYERNPETNRCRRTQVVLAASPSVGSLDAQSAGRVNYLFLLLMSIAVFLYGAYEYRRDFANLLARLRQRRMIKIAASK